MMQGQRSSEPWKSCRQLIKAEHCRPQPLSRTTPGGEPSGTRILVITLSFSFRRVVASLKTEHKTKVQLSDGRSLNWSQRDGVHTGEQCGIKQRFRISSGQEATFFRCFQASCRVDPCPMRPATDGSPRPRKPLQLAQGSPQAALPFPRRGSVSGWSEHGRVHMGPGAEQLWTWLRASAASGQEGPAAGWTPVHQDRLSTQALLLGRSHVLVIWLRIGGGFAQVLLMAEEFP